jgi:hypothetical protein
MREDRTMDNHYAIEYLARHQMAERQLQAARARQARLARRTRTTADRGWVRRSLIAIIHAPRVIRTRRVGHDAV